jgi:TusA-related sulfurtransferase
MSTHDPESTDTTPDATRDFRGVRCPLNYVKTRLALEDMPAGRRLRVLLDDGDPIRNVPEAVRADGHAIERQDRAPGGHWELVIRKA